MLISRRQIVLHNLAKHFQMLPKPQHRLKIFADKNVTEIRGNLPGCFKKDYSENFTELVAKHLQGIAFAAELQTSMPAIYQNYDSTKQREL